MLRQFSNNRELVLRKGVLCQGQTIIQPGEVEYVHTDLVDNTSLVIKLVGSGSDKHKLKLLKFDSDEDADAGCKWLTGWLIDHHGPEFRNKLNEGAARLASSVATHSANQLASSDAFTAARGRVRSNSDPQSPDTRRPDNPNARAVSFQRPPAPEVGPDCRPQTWLGLVHQSVQRHPIEGVVFGATPSTRMPLNLHTPPYTHRSVMAHLT